jgi:hypothetical protein
MTRQEAEKLKEFITTVKWGDWNMLFTLTDEARKVIKDYIDSLVEESPKEQPKKIERIDIEALSREWEHDHVYINSEKINEIIDHLNGEA